MPTKTQISLSTYIGPRLKRSLENSEYLGICVLVAPGAWTRVGPTWRRQDGCYVICGPGANRWGTSKGLAELATSPDPKPNWHAVGASLVPDPQLIFIATPKSAALTGPEVVELDQEAASWCEQPVEVRS